MTNDDRIRNGRLVYELRISPTEARRMMASNGLEGLEIFSQLQSQRLANLEFLKDYSFLLDLRISTVFDYDFSVLRSLTNLRRLSLSIWSTGRISVPELSEIGSLESLSLDWRKEYTGIGNCKHLTYLALMDYPGPDLQEIADLRQLGQLVIKGAALRNLTGIGDSAQLRHVRLAACPKLGTIESLSGLPRLEKLEIEASRKLRDISYLKTLTALRELRLVDCGIISSLTFVSGLKNLQKVSILGDTTIADGNLNPLAGVPEVFCKPGLARGTNLNLSRQEQLAIKNRQLLEKVQMKILNRAGPTKAR